MSQIYAELPLYTPSEPSPKYSYEPTTDECTLQQTPLHVQAPPTGNFIRKSGKTTITLFEQRDGVDMPEYPERPLPPSFFVDQSLTSSFYLRIQYSITFCITRVRQNMGVFTKCDEIMIPFKYHPRVRAHRPILSNHNFLSTVKGFPDEWHQSSSELKTRCKLSPGQGAINCLFFVPSARVYGLADKIPFHIQLNGSLDDLQKLLMPQPDNAPPPPSWSSKKSHEKCPPHTKPKIRVYLLRQSEVTARSFRSWRNMTIGEGEIWELPPSPICDFQGPVLHLDWAGELRVDPSVKTGGFTAGNATVKDFLVLTLEPPTVNKQVSPFLSLQMTVPIRIVTDSYVEVTDYEPPSPPM
ncbi:hypothetical protein H0H93_014847 [Arthromyces matolae]|nr:hypothetical protein H0H93_014847 [Arthromyces matolae]